MKKFVLGFILFGVCFLSGCTNSAYDLVKNNAAEIREGLYQGENSNINVTLSTGMREKDYVINGVATELVEFGVLTFNVLNEQQFSGDVSYVLTIGSTRFDGLLEQNPYDLSYVVDIKQIVNTNDVVTAKIIAGDFVEEVELNDVTKDWVVSYENALKLASEELRTQIEQNSSNNIFNGEFYVKILNDSQNKSGTYFWYVNFTTQSGKVYSIVIDPVTNEVMAKKAA